jgi:hypothetical protein
MSFYNWNFYYWNSKEAWDALVIFAVVGLLWTGAPSSGIRSASDDSVRMQAVRRRNVSAAALEETGQAITIHDIGGDLWQRGHATAPGQQHRRITNRFEEANDSRDRERNESGRLIGDRQYLIGDRQLCIGDRQDSIGDRRRLAKNNGSS